MEKQICKIINTLVYDTSICISKKDMIYDINRHHYKTQNLFYFKIQKNGKRSIPLSLSYSPYASTTSISLKSSSLIAITTLPSFFSVLTNKLRNANGHFAIPSYFVSGT